MRERKTASRGSFPILSQNTQVKLLVLEKSDGRKEWGTKGHNQPILWGSSLRQAHTVCVPLSFWDPPPEKWWCSFSVGLNTPNKGQNTRSQHTPSRGNPAAACHQWLRMPQDSWHFRPSVGTWCAWASKCLCVCVCVVSGVGGFKRRAKGKPPFFGRGPLKETRQVWVKP